MVLLQSFQENLVQAAGSMLQKQNLSAPSFKLTKKQRHAIYQDPQILQLRHAKQEVIKEIQSLTRTKKKAQKTFPHLYQKHKLLCKELSQLRKILGRHIKKTARKEHFYNIFIFTVNRQIKQLLSQVDSENSNIKSPSKKNQELSIPIYIFSERECLIENFCSLNTENYKDNKLLTKCI